MARRSPSAVALVLLVLVAVLLLGCGGADEPSRPLGADGLRRALELARDAGPLPVRLHVTTTRPGRGTRRQFSGDGRIDLAARSGEARLALEGAEDLGLPKAFAISWTATHVRGHGRRMSRARARSTGGQLGMLPDQLQAMAELVADAEAVRERGNGRWTSVLPRDSAVRRGIPRQPPAPGAWTGEAAAAADGRLRRVVLRVPTPALTGSIKAGTARLDLELG